MNYKSILIATMLVSGMVGQQAHGEELSAECIAARKVSNAHATKLRNVMAVEGRVVAESVMGVLYYALEALIPAEKIKIFKSFKPQNNPINQRKDTINKFGLDVREYEKLLNSEKNICGGKRRDCDKHFKNGISGISHALNGGKTLEEMVKKFGEMIKKIPAPSDVNAVVNFRKIMGSLGEEYIGSVDAGLGAYIDGLGGLDGDNCTDGEKHRDEIRTLVVYGSALDSLGRGIPGQAVDTLNARIDGMRGGSSGSVPSLRGAPSINSSPKKSPVQEGFKQPGRQIQTPALAH